MHKLLFIASAVFLLAVGPLTRFLVAPALTAGEAPGTAAGTAASGAALVKAASEFVAGLNAAERAKAVFSFNDAERFDWHFIPKPRKGLALNELSAAQKESARRLLEVSLSEVGFKTVEDVRALEGILREIEGPERRFPRDPELYYVSVFGTPGATGASGASGAWGWRFEGHHLSLNVTLDGEKVLSSTPLFLGANPAVVKSGPRKGLRLLADVEDLARELMKSLDDAQRGQALGKEAPEDVKGAQAARYTDELPRGLKGDKLNETQAALLGKLWGGYARNLRDDARREAEKALDANGGWKSVEIAWRGSLEPFQGHSYMIHGPSFIIAYANFQNDAAHVHSIFRQRRLEFGLED